MAKDYALAPAIKQPSIIPYLIRGENAPEFLKDFNQLVKAEYNDNSHLKVLGLNDVEGVPTIVGSNTLVLPVVQRLVSGKRIGRPEDLQRTLNDGDTLSIRGNHYIDLGAVLDFTGRNHEIALDFWEQLQGRAPEGFGFVAHRSVTNLDMLPALIVGYGLANFDKGKYNLRLVNNSNTQVRPAKILAGRNGNFDDSVVSLETGLPSKLGNGNRTLYTASQKAQSLDNLGLSRLCLYRYLYSDSYNVYLSYSYDYGRVVLF